MRTPKDWGQPCPHPACAHDSRMTSLTHSGKRRLLRCHTGATQFSETCATVFFDLRPAEDNVMMALKMLLVRVALPGIGCVLGVTEATVVAWRRRAAHQAAVITRPLRRALPVTQVQRDARWHCIERTHAGETEATGESVPDGEEGRQGIWISVAPECGRSARVSCLAPHACPPWAARSARPWSNGCICPCVRPWPRWSGRRPASVKPARACGSG